MKNQEFPVIPEALIKVLNEMWPERCPEMDWTEPQIWHYVGQRSVVKYLMQVFKDQNENVLRSR